MLEMKNCLLCYSLSSIGLIALVYKLYKWVRTNQLRKVYFKNKTVLITGASSGLGKAIAEELYPLGAQLILCARNYEELNKLKQNLMKSEGKEPEILSLDVSSKTDVLKPKIDELIKKFNCIDILVNNAGISYRGETFTTSEEVFERAMNVNYFGAIRMTNLIVKNMIDDDNKCTQSKLKRKNYSIVNIGSVQSYLAIPYRSAYGATKHALLAYSDSLRAELHSHKNINVLNIQPGYIKTNLGSNALHGGGVKKASADNDHENGYEPNYVAQVLIDSVINRNKEVIVDVLLHRVVIWIRFFFPNLYFFIMSIRAKINHKKKFQ